MAERYRVRITPRAADDITEICAYIEQDSPKNAALLARELVDAIGSIDLLPHRYRIHEHRREPAKTVHAMPVPPFIVYYRVTDRDRVVDVLTVLHGKRRQPERFE